MGKSLDLKTNKIEKHEDHFVCPDCHKRFKESEDKATIICENCGANFSFRNGIYDLYSQVPFAEVNSIDFAELYQELGKNPMTEDSEALRRNTTVSMVNGGRILELGCNKGQMTERLARLGQVYAADISMSYLEKVKNRVPGVTLVRLDAHKLPFEDLFFDNILMTDVLEHVLVPSRVLEEVRRVLKPEGKLIIGVPNILNFSNILRHFISSNPNSLLNYTDAHISFYDPAGLFQLLAATGFFIKRYHPIYPFSTARNIIPPAILGFLDDLFRYMGRYFAREMLVVAQKSEKKYWETLKSKILQRKAMSNKDKHE